MPFFMRENDSNAFDRVRPIRRLPGRMCRIAGYSQTTAAPRGISVATRAAAVPPQAFFVGSAVFHYLGPSFALLLFARVDVLGVAWLRLASPAVVFAAWRRPWRKLASLDREGGLLIAGLGAVF